MTGFVVVFVGVVVVVVVLYGAHVTVYVCAGVLVWFACSEVPLEDPPSKGAAPYREPYHGDVGSRVGGAVDSSRETDDIHTAVSCASDCSSFTSPSFLFR